jgi:cytochrome c
MNTLQQTAIGIVAAFLMNFAHAGERANSDEAVAFVKSAIQYIKANGKEKAYAEFSNPNGRFKDRDMYIYVVDMNYVALAHGANQRLIGKELKELRDADGKYFVKAYVDMAKEKGSSWTDFKWVNPVTSKIEAKSAYVERFADVVVGSGIYKETK